MTMRLESFPRLRGKAVRLRAKREQDGWGNFPVEREAQTSPIVMRVAARHDMTLPPQAGKGLRQ
jgi:hypothetical protein